MDVVSILMTKAEFRFIGRATATGHAIVGDVGPRPVVRMDQAFPCADVRLDLLVRIPEHLLPSRRIHYGVRFKVPVPDTFLAAGDRQRETFFTFTQEALGPLPLANVP